MHKIYFTLFLSFSLILYQLPGNAQVENALLSHYKDFEPRDSNKVFLRIENFNFAKNNEYTGNFADGTTWLGYLLSPKLVYCPTSTLRIEAGVRLQKYSGLTDYSDSEPLLTVHYALNPHASFILGALNQNANHKLPEPLFEPERFFSSPAENGLQFILNYNRFYLDTWINWEQFIFQNDPFQERFTLGVSSHFYLTKPKRSGSFIAPLQVLVSHKGGEIDTSPSPVQTLVNLSSGLQYIRSIKGSFIKSWNAEALTFYFKDHSSQKQFPYSEGHAFYPSVGISTNHAQIQFGYWNAYCFVASRGSQLFQSISSNIPNFKQNRRELLTAKYVYEKDISAGIRLGGKMDFYLDTKNHTRNFAAAVYLVFNENFFLKKIR